MVRYLNSKTREDVVIIAGAIHLLKDVSSRWNDNMNNPPKKVTRFLRSAASFSECAMRELDKELDNNEVARIYRLAETTRLQLAYTKHDLSSKTPEAITYDINEDERDAIVEALAEVRCSKCDGRKKDCVVRNQFFKWDITPMYEVVDDNHPCQYIP